MATLKDNQYSYLTAKERDKISFPARYLYENGWLKGSVLDFGCGQGTDVNLLKQRGIDITGYDPHYFPIRPKQKFDTIICFYVLNVLLPKEQAEVLMDISTLLLPGGAAYFAVRRDLQYEGYRMHKLHRKQTYQCTVKLPYESVLRTESCEIYKYQQYTQRHQGNILVSPFLDDGPRELLVETATAFAIYDKYPVTTGHALVIPKRVVANYFELSWKEQMACWIIVNRVKQILDNAFSPNGFNVGINVCQSAGQTISHAHIHVIPRYNGDVPEPRGGVRGVIPDKRSY